MFECSECNETFTKPDSLRQHRYRHHRKTQKPKVRYFCYYCKFETSYKQSLPKHMMAHLSNKAKPIRASSRCLLCGDFESSNRSVMIQHYQAAHDVRVEEQTLRFNSFVEFEAWKRETEVKEACRFSMRGGIKRTQDHSTAYYRCFRSGHYKGEGSGKRKLKIKGSCRMGGICTSSIKVTTYNSGIVCVKYVAGHVGHTADVGRLSLSEQEKNEIVCKLAAGFTIGTIVDSLRESICSDQVSRLQLTSHKEVWNIKNALRLKHGPETRKPHSTHSAPSGLPDVGMRDDVADQLVAEDADASADPAICADPSPNELVLDPKTRLKEMKQAMLNHYATLLESAGDFSDLEKIKEALPAIPQSIKAHTEGPILTHSAGPPIRDHILAPRQTLLGATNPKKY